MLQYHEIIYYIILYYNILYYIILNGKAQHSAYFDYSVVSTKPGPHDAATAGAPPTAAPTATIATVMPLLLLVVLWYVVVGYTVGVVVVLLLCGGCSEVFLYSFLCNMQTTEWKELNFSTQ